MRVLVIGGTLFIGKLLVKRLLAADHDVTILHRRAEHPFGRRLRNVIAVFLSYEGYQEAIPFPGAGTTTIPLDLRNGQNFSKYGMTIYDPLTTHPCGRVGHRTLQRIERFHLLAQPLPRRRDSAEPHQPGSPEDPFLMFPARTRPVRAPAVWPMATLTDPRQRRPLLV